MAATNRPRIEAFIGASGSGKGVSINRLLDAEKPARLIIWDPRDEYGKRAPRYDQMSYLIGAVRHAKGGPVRARFVPGGTADLKETFGMLCRVAFVAGNLTFLAEELSDVTQPSWAPPAWKQVITQGRHQGLHVIGAAQRPALVDKNFLGNATYIRCFALRYDDDCTAMAKALRVPVAQVAELQTVEEPTRTTINYLERDFRGGAVAQPGQVVLRRPKGAT